MLCFWVECLVRRSCSGNGTVTSGLDEPDSPDGLNRRPSPLLKFEFDISRFTLIRTYFSFGHRFALVLNDASSPSSSNANSTRKRRKIFFSDAEGVSPT